MKTASVTQQLPSLEPVDERGTRIADEIRRQCLDEFPTCRRALEHFWQGK